MFSSWRSWMHSLWQVYVKEALLTLVFFSRGEWQVPVPHGSGPAAAASRSRNGTIQHLHWDSGGEIKRGEGAVLSGGIFRRGLSLLLNPSLPPNLLNHLQSVSWDRIRRPVWLHMPPLWRTGGRSGVLQKGGGKTSGRWLLRSVKKKMIEYWCNNSYIRWWGLSWAER